MTTTLTRRWQLVHTLSSARFAVRNLGVKTVTGCVPIRSASVEVGADGRPIAVQATLDLSALDTGNTRRDRDLGKPGLLDTGRFPTITFAAGAGTEDEAGWRIPGTLAARGASTQVVLAVTVDHRGTEAAVHATTSFDRRELGIRAPRVLIGRRIEVTVDAVLRPA
jgi:polyisoprenoid-binding protein YceI